MGLKPGGKLRLVTSSLTLTEVLVIPFRMKMMDLLEGYKETLTKSANFEIQSFDLKIAERAALIRAIYGFRTPGAIQIATAIEYGADSFLTNDTKLKKLKDINIIMVKEL